MSRRKQWFYADAATNSVGLMICTACRKPIETGLFRYRETDDAYLPQHRACCEDDRQWAEIDASRAPTQFEPELLAAVLRERGKSNSLHDINRAADALDHLANMLAAAKNLSDVYEAIWIKVSDGEMALMRAAWDRMDAAIAAAKGAQP